MKTEKELNEAILKITLLIQEKFPELSQFVGEMPVTVPDESKPEINRNTLQEYYHSLQYIVKKYSTYGEAAN